LEQGRIATTAQRIYYYTIPNIVDKNNCSNYQGIPLLSSILLAKLTPYIESILGDYQCGF
jgi:hypothetical protein